MKTKLNTQEVVNAITSYMALKGYKTGDNFRLKWDKYLGRLDYIEFDIEQSDFHLKDIQEFARKN